MTRAPASMTSPTWSLRWAKSADRIDGATRGARNSCVCIPRQRSEKKGRRGRPFPLRWREAETNERSASAALVLLTILVRSLRVVLTLVVPRPGRLANDRLARGVDHVGEVSQHRVVAIAAVDDVLLAVADVEAVVARAAVQCVAGVVGVARDVVARERPEVVVPVVSEDLVLSLIGEDSVVAGPAVERVVAAAARDLVRSVAAVDRVAAVAAVQAVLRVAADDRVVARAAEDA